MESQHSEVELLDRAQALRDQAKRAMRLAYSFPIDGDKELLLRQARELDDQAEKLECQARE